MEQQEVAGQVVEPQFEKNRPGIITVICVISFIGAVFTIPAVFSTLAKQVGGWYPPYLAFAAIIGLVCMIGLWNMKKWAAYTYTAMVLINQIVLSVMGVWNVFALLIPAIVVVAALVNLKKMN